MPYGIANRAGQPDTAQVAKMLALAKGAGVRCLDTAPAYGSSEARIGELAGGDPEWVIITKLANTMGARASDASEAAALALASVRTSQRALRRDRIDGLLLHRAADRTAFDGAIWDALRVVRANGEIGVLGVSAATPDEAFDALGAPGVEAVQVACSLLDQRLARVGFFAQAAAAGVKVFVRSVYLQGVAHLASHELWEHLALLAPTLVAVRDWTAERGLPVAAAYLAFARSLPADQVIVGAETVDQVGATLDAWALAANLAVEELARAVPDFGADIVDPSRW